MRVVDRATFVVIALAWLGVGVFGNVPWFGDYGWVAVCAIPAGASFAIAQHLTEYALRAFVWTSLIVAVLRSTAYLTNGIEGPLFVWVIVIGLIFLVRERLIRHIE